MKNGEMTTKFMRSIPGLPFYVTHTAPAEDSSPISFDRNFNPDMKRDSEYFNKLDKFLGCVERNAPKGLSEGDQNRVCGKEFKNLRSAAFDNELLYHNMNKRFFMDLL